MNFRKKNQNVEILIFAVSCGNFIENEQQDDLPTFAEGLLLGMVGSQKGEGRNVERGTVSCAHFCIFLCDD